MASREAVETGLSQIRTARKVALGAWLFAALIAVGIAVVVRDESSLAWYLFAALFIAVLCAGTLTAAAGAAACPNCGRPYHYEGDDLFTAFHSDTTTKRCLNCGLRLDGSNLRDYGV